MKDEGTSPHRDMPMRFHRMGLLAGPDGMTTLGNARVALFGLGGVGSWTAECLVRSGITDILLVDADNVAESNINRQLVALGSTIGRPKADVLRERLLDINPDANIEVRAERYTADTADSFDLQSFTHVIDAIDSLADKALLISRSTSISGLRFFSSMGAAMRLDPSHIHVDEFRKVKGCRLAAALRSRFKRTGMMPRRKFKCVFSDEQPIARPADAPEDTSGAMTYGKVAVNGAACHITAIFGMTLASLVINDIIGRSKN